MCNECWLKIRPGEEPARLMNDEFETCCFCGKEHASGIYIRHDPKELSHCKHD